MDWLLTFWASPFDLDDVVWERVSRPGMRAALLRGRKGLEVPQSAQPEEDPGYHAFAAPGEGRI